MSSIVARSRSLKQVLPLLNNVTTTSLLNGTAKETLYECRCSPVKRVTFASVTEKVEGVESSQGWGQTKITDVLKMKSDMGAWLFCSKDDMVIDAVKKMAEANVGSLVVFDPSKVNLSDKKSLNVMNDAVCGIITERDYLKKIICEGRSSKDTPVSTIMTSGSKLLTVSPDKSVLEAMELMADNNIRHLPVVNNNTMQGMVFN